MTAPALCSFQGCMTTAPAIGKIDRLPRRAEQALQLISQLYGIPLRI